MENTSPIIKEQDMTKYMKVTTIIAIPDDAIPEGYDHESIIADLMMNVEDHIDNAGMHLNDVCIHEMTLVETSWLDSITQPDSDDDDDDDGWVFTPAPPTISVTPAPAMQAQQPQGVPQLDLTGVDPTSPEAEDIIQQFVDATTPEPDADDAT